MKSISMGEHADIVRRAFAKQFGDDNGSWVMDTFADYVIAQDYRQPLYYKVAYTMSGVEVTFVPRDAWELVEREYVPVAMGSAIKTLGDGKLGGHLIVYGDEKNPDIEGDYFTKSTEFDFENGDARPVYYIHGLDGALKKRKIGNATLTRDEVGVWVEAQLNMRDEYEKAIYQLATEGKVGWSSGAAAHMVERERVGKSLHVKKWAIAEASLTPTPAEPRAQVVYMKTSGAALYLPEAQPEGAKVPAGAANSAGSITVTDNAEDNEMNEEQVKALETSNAALKTQLDAMSEQMRQVLQFMQDSPAIKGAGYFTQDGGTADKHIKSLGDYLLSIMRGDEKRLASLYGSLKTTMDGQTGALGGYTVPTEYSTQLMQLAAEQSRIVNRVKRIPVNTAAGEYPSLDQFFKPAAGTGETAMAGKAKTAKRTEGGSYTETNPEFEVVRYRVNDVASGMIKVTKELRADTPIGIESFLRNVISIAVSAKLEQLILRGNGVGEPLGILNAPARVDVAAAATNTFAYADALKMVSRIKAMGGSPMWVYHPGVINEIGVMQNGSGGPVWLANLSAGFEGQRLLGYEMATSEHMPQQDNADSIALLDLSAYVLFERGGMYIEFSEHFAFGEGKDTWRFGMRCDGQPWLKGKITLADPQNAGSAYEVSPFVVFTN